ncbi:MAG: MATE family efflux transporter [Spirochaetales bacterium]|nr:MATE family efflux transporter [Spirochaetales bacterium]
MGNRDDVKGKAGVDMGNDPIGGLLLKLSLPATVALVVMGLYNLVDTIFIGRGVGTVGIGGLSLILPVQALIGGFGLAVGQGAASVVSRNLGAKNYDRARRAAGNAFTLALLSGLTLSVGAYLFTEPLLDLLGATEALRDTARTYLRIILIGAPFMTMAMSCNNLLRAEGKAKESMRVMLTGAIANLILDPIFIFVFDMGVAGAALATILGQMLNFAFGIRYFVGKKTSVTIDLAYLKPEGSVVKETILLGIPTFVRQAGQSVVGILLNNLLGAYGGDIYISAYGIINRLLMFLMMPLFGMAQGFQPIAGFNYGARKYGRVRKSLWLTGIFATLFSTLVFLLLNIFPRTFAGIFTADGALIDSTVQVMRYIFLIFPLVGLQITGSTYFMVVGKPTPSLILNLSRQFIFLIPLILILPSYWGMRGLLSAFPVADFSAALITVLWLMKELSHLGESALAEELLSRNE